MGQKCFFYPTPCASQQGWQPEGNNLVPISTRVRNVLAWDMSDASLFCTVVYFLNQNQMRRAAPACHGAHVPIPALALLPTPEGLLAPTAHQAPAQAQLSSALPACQHHGGTESL